MEALALNHIVKTYPGVRALDGVSISFEKGEVHAIVGENGAGKSTFIKVITGATHPDSGSIVFEGKAYDRMEPLQARRLGIAVVYQELIQFEAMTVADNIHAGMKRERGGFLVDDKRRRQDTEALLKRFGCDVSPAALIRTLSIANRQIIEIAKAVAQDAKIVIMDEPTASITVEEQKHMFGIVRDLKARGVTVIYISHRLEELYEICDRVTVLRDGQYVATKRIGEVDKQALIQLMVGRKLSESYPAAAPARDEVVLKVTGLCGNGLHDISFELKRGEILGFAGLVGAGRTELMHLLFGAAKRTSGEVVLHGKAVILRDPGEGLAAGVGLIPEDRKRQGCFLEKPVYWNISVSNLKRLCKRGIVNRRLEMEQARAYQESIHIKTPSLRQLTLNLSGGNQQKVVVAKVLAAQPDILIFDEPTRGIDVGARQEIYAMMVELARSGKSILMVSSDMEELLGMSQRIIVLHEGRQKGMLSRDEFSQERILTLASGI